MLLRTGCRTGDDNVPQGHQGLIRCGRSRRCAVRVRRNQATRRHQRKMRALSRRPLRREVRTPAPELPHISRWKTTARQCDGHELDTVAGLCKKASARKVAPSRLTLTYRLGTRPGWCIPGLRSILAAQAGGRTRRQCRMVQWRERPTLRAICAMSALVLRNSCQTRSG